MPNLAWWIGRRPRAPAIFLAIAVAVAVGCSPDSASPAAGLAGTSWTVMTINGGNVIANAPPTIAFSTDRRISGTTGCNQYSALFSTDGNRITVGSMQSTRMLCDGATAEQETAFLNGLGGAAAWRINGAGDLEIDGAAAIVARRAVPGGQPSSTPVPSGAGVSPAEPSELADTSWTLAEMGGTADFAHIIPTIDFRADGEVSGFAGCNTFSGTYMTDGQNLKLSPLATTKIGCPRPASAVESDYLNALAGVTTWLVDVNGRLILGGMVPMKFAPR